MAIHPVRHVCAGATDTSPRPTDVWAQRVGWALTVFMRWFSAHWLAMANLALALYISLPLLAPWLEHTGHHRLGGLIYLVFRPLCHQLPERSFFLFGPKTVYSYSELADVLGGVVPQRHVGLAEIGYKIAICQRCVAIYLTALGSGLLFSLLRRKLGPLPLPAFGLMLMPVAVDGFGQLLKVWESSWASRLATGSLFGLACVWLAFPYVEIGMRQVYQDALKALTEWGTLRGRA